MKKLKKTDIIMLIVLCCAVIAGLIFILVSIFGKDNSKGMLIAGLLCVNIANVINIINLLKRSNSGKKQVRRFDDTQI